MSAGAADLRYESVVPLCNIVAKGDGTPYPDENAVTDYVGIVTTTAVVKGCADVSAKPIVFRVGTLGPAANLDRPDDVHRLDTSMDVSEALQKDCKDMGLRSAAMPVSWKRMDLFGVVERLAMGMAHFSTWGTLSCAVLRGGGNISVAAIAAATGPISANVGAVFVSAKTVTHARPNVMAALANAISGEGGTMYTDLLGIDLAGVVQVPTATGAALAQGCYDALRILGSMFRMSGKGAFYAYAVTKGIHEVLTVHGHSDEGAYVRNVIRANYAGVPYGAIVTDIAEDNAIPNPLRSVAGFRSVVHSIALGTAGLVALADPMVERNGKCYPTTLVTTNGATTDPSDNTAGDRYDALELASQWANVCGPWAANYARGLNELFCTSGGVAETVRLIVAQATALTGVIDRHMNYRAAVAFCWIEPTCSCPIGDETYIAYRERHGPLARTDRPRIVPMFDGCAEVQGGDDAMTRALQVDFRFARRHGLLVHLHTHAQDGLTHLKLISGLVNDFAMVGGQGDLGPRIMQANGLETFMWGRGHSSLVAPGELIHVGGSLVFYVQNVGISANGAYVSNHIPNMRELLSGEVQIHASRLSGGPPTAPNAVPVREVRRARSEAAIALLLAREAGRMDRAPIQMRVRPALVDHGEVPRRGAVAEVRAENEPVAPSAPAPPEAVDGAYASGPAPGGGYRNGPAARHTVVNTAAQGPRVNNNANRLAGQLGAAGVNALGAGGAAMGLVPGGMIEPYELFELGPNPMPAPGAPVGHQIDRGDDG